MTDQELQAVRGRCAAATPGPWLAEPGASDPDAPHLHGKYTFVLCSGPLSLATVWEHAPGGNGAFIAHARQDVPALLAEVERLRGALRSLEEAFRSVIRVVDGEGRP
jgi:hypothetical protein